MEDPVYVASTTVSTTNAMPNIGFDIFAILGAIFGGGDGGGFFSFFSLDGLLGVFGVLWTILIILGYLLAILFLVLYVYASVRLKYFEELEDTKLRREEELFDEHYRGVSKNSRLQDVVTHSQSSNPNDWKLAIIEADIILDETLKQRGYAGTTLGERLKSISPGQLDTLNDAWEAHKIRNQIAHGGADFVLTQRLAQETVGRYQRVFAEFGVQ